LTVSANRFVLVQYSYGDRGMVKSDYTHYNPKNSSVSHTNQVKLG